MFHPDLPDDVEERLESSIDINDWNWTITAPSSTSSGGTAVQCKGIAKSTGVRCKNKTNNQNGYCHHHQDQDPNIKTASGTESSSKSTSASKSSWVNVSGGFLLISFKIFSSVFELKLALTGTKSTLAFPQPMLGIASKKYISPGLTFASTNDLFSDLAQNKCLPGLHSYRI